ATTPIFTSEIRSPPGKGPGDWAKAFKLKMAAKATASPECNALFPKPLFNDSIIFLPVDGFDGRSDLVCNNMRETILKSAKRISQALVGSHKVRFLSTISVRLTIDRSPSGVRRDQRSVRVASNERQ